MRVTRSQLIIGKTRKFLKTRIKGVDKRRQRIIPEIFLGILISGSTILAQMGRAVNKSAKRKIKSVENSFSGHLNSPAWSEGLLQENHLRLRGRQVKQDTLILIDPSEVVKRYGRKMEYIAYVRDESDSDKPLRLGYWTFESYALDGDKLFTLLNFPFSVEDPETLSFPGAVEGGIEKIIHATGGRGIYISDRAFDDRRYFEVYEENKAKFIIRLKKNRQVTDLDGILLGEVSEIATKLEYKHWFKKVTKQTEELIGYTWLKVKVPECSGEFTLVICYHKGNQEEKYSCYLTNGIVIKSHDAERVVRRYMRREKIEEGIRLAKQECGLEDFLVQRFSAIKKLMAISYLAVDYILEYGEISRNMVIWFERLGQSFRKEVDFIYYRISMGLKSALGGLKTREFKLITRGLTS